MAAPDRTTKLDGEPIPASARIAAALGLPDPKPMGPAEARAFEAKQDRADTEAEEIWGIRQQSAA